LQRLVDYTTTTNHKNGDEEDIGTGWYYLYEQKFGHTKLVQFYAIDNHRWLGGNVENLKAVLERKVNVPRDHLGRRMV